MVNWKTTRLRESRCAGRRGVFRDGAGVDVDAEEFGGVEEHEDVGAEVDDGCLNGADESDECCGDAEDVDDSDADEQVLFDGAVGAAGDRARATTDQQPQLSRSRCSPADRSTSSCPTDNQPLKPRMTHKSVWRAKKNDLIPQVQDIITVGEFYEIAAGGQIIFT